MKPNFALDLKQDGIGLLHRAGANWLWLGAVPLNAPGFAKRLQALRREANVFERDGMTTKIVIPNSEILYAELHAPGPGSVARKAQIREGLQRLTPCDIEDLVFDWRPAGHHAQVAAVARDTLREAEAFAVGHRFNPISLVAVPEPDRFEGEPFFGVTAHAAGILANGEYVEPDIETMAVIGRRRQDEGDSERQTAKPGAIAGSATSSTEVANATAPPRVPERNSSETASSDGRSPMNAEGAEGDAIARTEGMPGRNNPGGEDRLQRQDMHESPVRRTEPDRKAETIPAKEAEIADGLNSDRISSETDPSISQEPLSPAPESPEVHADPNTGRMQPAAANASEGRYISDNVRGKTEEEQPSSRILLLETERKARPDRDSGATTKKPAARGPGDMGARGIRTRASSSQLAFEFLDDLVSSANTPGNDAKEEESAHDPATRPVNAPIPGPGHNRHSRTSRDAARRSTSMPSGRSPPDSGDHASNRTGEPEYESAPATARARQSGNPPANVDGATAPSGGNGQATRRRKKSPKAAHPAFDFDPAPSNDPGEFDFEKPASVARRADTQEPPNERAANTPERNRRGEQRRKMQAQAGHPALDFGDTSACKQARLDLASSSAAKHRSPPSGKPRIDANGRTAPKRSVAPGKERSSPESISGAHERSGSEAAANKSLRRASPPSGKPALVADRAARPTAGIGRAPQRLGILAWAGVALALGALAAIVAVAIRFGNPALEDRTDESGPTGFLAEPSPEAPAAPELPDIEPFRVSTETAGLQQHDPEPSLLIAGENATTAPAVPRPFSREDEIVPPDQDDGSTLPRDAAGSTNQTTAVPQIRPDFAATVPGSGTNEDSSLVGAAFAAPLLRPTGRFGAVVSRAPALRPTASTQTGVAAAAAQGIRNLGAPLPRPNDIGRIAESAITASLQANPGGVSVASAATQRDALDPGTINLIGVYGSGTGRRAIVRLQSGRIVTVETGDRMDGGRVFAIGEGELSYVKGGHNHLLRMPRG